ncbi:MAG TPA: hypothetical protein VGO93_22750 [Candidatus Xenobia bacterium]|jgi:hypothetical protein
MRRFVIFGLLLALMVSVAQAAPNKFDFFSADSLADVGRRIRPLIEAETGRKYKVFPPIMPCTEQQMRTILAEELLPQLRLESKYAAKADSVAKETAAAMAPHILGKYTMKLHQVLVVPSNYETMLDVFVLQGSIDPRQLMRVVLTHELVHAQDQELYGIVGHVAKLKNPNQVKIWNALIEGHAQSVTRRVFAHLGQLKLFQDFCDRVQPPVPPGAPKEAVAYYHSLSFAYVDGMKFFDALHKAGTRGDEAGYIFSHPPTSIDQIEHPETYHLPK